MVSAMRRVAAMVGVSLFLGLAITPFGCGGGDPEAGQVVPVSGTVTYMDKPVAKGSILFQPEKGRAAQGTVENGKFTLSTYGENDGALPGKHKVALIATEEVAPKKPGK